MNNHPNYSMLTKDFNRVVYRTTLTIPDGSSLVLINKCNTSFMMYGIAELAKLLKLDDQGFSIASNECERIVPESIALIDSVLAFVNPQWCIMKYNDNDTFVIKNKNITSRIISECIQNASYKEFIFEYILQTFPDNASMKILVDDMNESMSYVFNV